MYLRPTISSSNNSILDYITSNQVKVNDLEDKVSSQKKLLRPSDNGLDAISVLNINKSLSQLDGYLENMATSQNELNVLDNTLSSVLSGLQRANDLSVQAANEVYNTTNLAGIKGEIDQIIDNMRDLGNTQFNGAFIFGGTNTGTAPFTDVATGGIQYTGTPQTGDYQRNIQIADGVTTAINVPGDKLLGSYDTTTATGSGAFKTLYELSDALGKNPPDFTTIRASLDQLQDEIQKTSDIRTGFASITQRFNMTKNSINTNILQLKTYKSNLEDIDLAEAATQLSAQKIALEATMSVAAQSLSSTNLLNYM